MVALLSYTLAVNQVVRRFALMESSDFHQKLQGHSVLWIRHRTMQTFLPYGSFLMTARSLDDKRLGKQWPELEPLAPVNGRFPYVWTEGE